MYFIIYLLSTGVTGNYNFLIFLFFSIFCLFEILDKKIVIPKNINFIFIFFFTLFYFIMSLINELEIITVFYPIILYYVGFVIIRKKISIKNIKLVCYSIIFGLFTHAMLNYITNFGSMNRNIVDFWLHVNYAATLQGTYVVMLLSTLVVTFLFESKFMKLIHFIASIFSVLFLLMIGTRTSLIISFLVSCYVLISFFFFNKNLSTSKKIKWSLFVICIIISCFVSYKFNYFSIKTTVENSTLFLRFSNDDLNSSDGSRIDNQFLGIKSLIDNPFGTKSKIGNLNYAHNMWLDLGKDVGIFPFLFLCLYSLFSLKSLFRFNKLFNVNLKDKLFINCIYFSCFLNFLVEPIFQGIPYFFALFVLINSMVDYYVIYNR